MRHLLVPFGLKPKPPEEGPRYGDVNDRSMAAAIDIMVLFYLVGPLTDYVTRTIFAAYSAAQPGSDMAHLTNASSMMRAIWEVREPWLLSNLATFILIGVFLITCQMAFATTPGKWLLGLKILRHGTLAPVARWRYIVRFLAYIPAALPLMLGVIWMSFNKQRRGWHDYIAGTVVINTRPRGWYWGKVKQGFRWLRGRITPSTAVEQPVAEPTAEQRHGDGDKPVP